VSPLPSFFRRHRLSSILLAVLLVPALIFTIWAGITLNFNYSEGERAGFLQKVSRRGWLCKTWEGELQLTAIPGSMPEMFYFTTRSDSVAAELNKLSGKRVVVEYEQHKGVPGTCFGDTEYFVNGVRAVE
jgi:hypothetical protein